MSNPEDLQTNEMCQVTELEAAQRSRKFFRKLLSEMRDTFASHNAMPKTIACIDKALALDAESNGDV